MSGSRDGQKGVVFVAAAGNGGPDAPAGYPAAYSEVIAVTAVDRKGGNYDQAESRDLHRRSRARRADSAALPKVRWRW